MEGEQQPNRQLHKTVEDFLMTLRYAIRNEAEGKEDPTNLHYLASNIFDIDDFSRKTKDQAHTETVRYNAEILSNLIQQPISLKGEKNPTTNLVNAAQKSRKQNDPNDLIAFVRSLSQYNKETRLLIRDLQEIYDELEED
ncbi:MAG: hypothetical protein S4CHLAM102_13610 [Chlamydiia bacterium]|nr:hypothetical protein [Chlamydiia bacterium]